MPPKPDSPLVLEIARIGLEVRVVDPEIRLVAEPAHVPFLAETKGEDCASVLLGPVSGRRAARLPGRTLFDTGSVWRLEEIGDNRLLTFRSPIFGRDPYLSVEFDRDYMHGQGETLDGGPVLTGGELHPFVYPFDEVVFLARLSRGRGVLVHACGLAFNGRGILFLGTSGAGKSTTARLWKERGGATILSDDRIVIRREAEGYRIYGTPWHGEAGWETPASARLDAVYILDQAPRNRVQEISPNAAVAQMMVRAFPSMWDQNGLEFAVRFLADMADLVPVRRLQFLPEPSAIDCVLAACNGGAAEATLRNGGTQEPEEEP
ncbi:MAG TPA: hypothetical protein VFT43_02790 [Candidatus Polarisedimenticolia bacterium]|nr:hypothetical protein [Candidatus Polarisedimenticolia bacterium]